MDLFEILLLSFLYTITLFVSVYIVDEVEYLIEYWRNK